MKTIATNISWLHILIGAVIGFLISFILFCHNGDDAYQSNRSSHKDGVNQHNGHNPYMMDAVTSEKQFVEDMILHHEAAVIMAQQVLILNPRQEVKALAEAIISAQTSEIALMKQWLLGWK